MYDRYGFDPEIEAKFKEIEREVASFWAPKKENIPLPEKAVRENWDDRKIREACTRKTPSGGGIFMVSEYWQLVHEIDRVRRYQK